MVSIEDGRDGSTGVVIFVGINYSPTERTCYVTLKHGSDPTKTAAILVRQAASGYNGGGGGGGRGLGDGEGNNLLRKNDLAVTL